MSHFDIIDAITKLGGTATEKDIRDMLSKDCPEKTDTKYFHLTLERLLKNETLSYVDGYYHYKSSNDSNQEL